MNPSIVPQTGHMMQPGSLAKLIPALGKNDESTKAQLAHLDEETWGKAAEVLVDMTRKQEAKASKSAWLANMDAATWDAVAKTVSEVASGISPAAGDAEGLDVPMWAKAATALNNIAQEERPRQHGMPRLR